MGKPAEHKAKAEHHYVFLERIPDEFPDWLATVAFYTAVELIEKLFAERGFHSRSHEDRNRNVIKQFPSIHPAYKALYNASMNARYESMEHWLTTQEVRTELIAKRLSHIRSFVTSPGRASRSRLGGAKPKRKK